MAGIKEMREKSKGLLEEMAERRARGEQPVGKPAPETPMEARTAPGRMFGLQEKIFLAEERARKAEEELENLMLSAGDSSALQSAETRVRQAEEALRVAEAALQEALKDQPVRKANLADLHEVPGRRRRLSAQQYTELRENLKSNPLTNPVTVRTQSGGGYEIIAGNNRVSAYRDLGWDVIDINILDLDDDETERAAFYSNLLAPSLPDYEKYIGFQARMKHKGLTQTQLAEEAGVSQSFVSTLMAFSDLPSEALEIIADAPELFGASAVTKLAQLTKAGNRQKVVEAIQKIASGELTQAAAVQFSSSTQSAIKPQRPIPLTIRRGKAKYCEILHADKTLRLSFASTEEASSILASIQKVVEARAAEKPE
jgi:ParB family chromosome partitioning protein